MKFSTWIAGATLLLSNLIATAATTTNQVSNAEGTAATFEGLDIAYGVGYSGIELLSTRDGIKPASSTKYGASGVAVQLKIGGNYAFCDMWLIGIEGYGQYNSAETKNTFYETATSATATKRTFTMDWNLGVDLRLGVAPTATDLIFVYGGPDWGRYDFHYTRPGLTASYKNFELGGVFGAGIEQEFAEKWTLRSTFDYRWYPNKKFTYSNGESQSIKARLATAAFLLGYTF